LSGKIVSNGLKKKLVTVQTNNWDFWQQAIIKKFGTSNWKRKNQSAFKKDQFVPHGETAVADWVTRQYKKLQAFEPTIDQEAVNFCLLGLMSGEVEYVAKTAMTRSDGHISALIDVLEDIVDKTRLGRSKFSLKPLGAVTPSKLPGVETDKAKLGTAELKCFRCDKLGHTSRKCRQKINVLSEDDPDPIGDDLGSDHDDSGLIIGIDSIPTPHVSCSGGRNNLVAMTCVGRECLVLLDSGAVRSVVSSAYLSLFCPQWRQALIPVKVGQFHSASGKLTPLGAVKVQLVFRDLSLVFQFVVMEDLKCPYFIVGNDYLVRHKISLLNDRVRQFRIGDHIFEFDERINVVGENQRIVPTPTKNQFVEQVLKEAKINDQLDQLQRTSLTECLQQHWSAFAAGNNHFGVVIGHEVGITLTVESPYPPTTNICNFT
jgi:hypothetical protein